MLGAQRRLPHVEMAKYRNATQNAKRTAKSSNFAAQVAPPSERLNYSLEGVAYTTPGKDENSSPSEKRREIGWIRTVAFYPALRFLWMRPRCAVATRAVGTRTTLQNLASQNFRPIEVLFIPSAKKTLFGERAHNANTLAF